VSYLCQTSPGAPRATVFPYTTLFRSEVGPGPRRAKGVDPDRECSAAGGARWNRPGRVGRAAPPRRVTWSWSTPRSGSTISTLVRSEEHTSELQSRENLVCRHLVEKKN